MGQTDKRKRRKGINVVYNISNELPKTAFEMETNNSNNKDLDEKEPDPVTIKELFRFASYSDIIWISFGVLFSILGGIIQPTVLIFDGYITSIFLRKEEKVGNDQFAADVKSYIILLGIGSIISFICTYLQTYMLHRGCINMICKIRRAFLQSVSRQDAVWFDRNSSGNIMTQLTDHINRIEDGLGNKIGLIIRGFSMFISSVIICMYINWKLTIISLTMGPISAITMGFLEKFLAEPAASLLSVNAEAGELVEESVMNVKTVASCNAQDYIVEKYKKILETGRHFVVKYHTLLGFSDGITFFEIYVIIGLALGFGVWGFFNGHVQLPGDIILVINTISLSGYYLGLLGPHVLAMIKARVAAAIIYKTIDRIPEQRIDDTSGIQLENVKGDITFDNVHFTYPTRSTSILNGLSWEAKAGETIAFVGSSGCGKSTSIGLLTRLYSQSTGKITIDGKPVDRINIASLRQNVGVVKQEPVLFNGTIMENIVLGRKNITEDQAMEAARITGVHNFISNLELGYNTQLGNDGINLSGGQKQRLAIARTIVTQPKILLLDEATSALDTESEQKLHKALMKTSKERTTIIIAHRLSTLKNVDRIYVIENGVIIENGAHEELIAQRGVYFDLAKSQEVHQRQEDTYKSDVPSTSTNYTQNDTRNISQKFSVVGRQSYIDDDDEDDENDIEVLQGFKLIFTNMQGNYGKFAASIFFCLLRSTELPFFGLSCYLAFKALQETADTYQAWAIWMMACSFTCSILIWLALVFQNMLSGLTAENVVNNMKVQALRSLLHRESEEFDQKNNNPSACISLLANHPPNILAGIDYRFMYYLTNVFAVLIGSIVCWNVLWEIAAIGTILCIILYILSFTSIIFANNARDRKEKEDNSFEHAVEIVEQCRSIQLLSTEKFFLSKYDEHQQLSKKFDYSIGHVNSFNFAIMQGFVFLSDMACFGIGTYLAYTGKYHVDTVYLACTAAQVSGWSVMYSAPNIPEIIRAASSAKQLFRVITSPQNILSRKNKGIKLDIEGKVEAKRLQFAYPTNPDNMVARNLNFIVKTGQHIALVGKSGCGKSTVINLMEKFYHARKGDILIDNNRIEEINTHHLRNQIALVGQEPILFKGSIYENVTMGLSNIPLEKVRQACKAANAAHFIESFPSGYDTDVGEKGRALSGGQKQRIAIARALIRNPKILLLDEATSALDTQSEEMVQQAINNASKDRTCISIAHRLSTIQNCDKIYLIDQGSVIECGTHSELLALNGAYANLVEAQRLQDNQ